MTQPDPDGGGGLSAPVWTYVYGANTLLASVTDPLSHVTTLGYDDYGRKTTSTTDLGYVTTFGYDLEDKLTSVTTPDPDGAGGVTASVTSYEYDIFDNLKKITDPLAGETTFTYDKAQQLLTLDDPEHNTTTWAYDALGRVTMETNELSDTRSFYHDAAGNLTRKTDRNERVTQYVYDELNRMVEEHWIDGGTPVPSIAIATTTQGGAADEVQRVGYTVTGMGASGGTFTLTFSGQTTAGIAYNASAATVQSALEALSNIGVGDVTVTKLQSTVNAQEWQVNFGGALAGADQSQITINTASVIAFGTKTNIQATDTAGQPSTTDEVQTITLSNATGGTFRLAFGGQTTAPLDYDASAGDVETALEALTSVDQVTVSGSAGGPWTVTFAGTHADTNVATLQGDAATAESGTVVRELVFDYDLANQLTDASDPAADYSYTYDYLGRVTSETQDLANFTPNVVLDYTWDVNNNRLTMAATLGANDDFLDTYTYDYLNRMTRVVQEGQGGGNTLATKRVDFAYNGLGQFTTIDRYQNSGGSNIVAQSTFAYDDDNRLTDLDHKQSTTTLAGYDYGYDNMGRITSIDSYVEDVSTFTYDKTSQLTGADHTSPRADETYTYDDNGNRTGGSYTVTGNNLTTSDGTYDYEYDDEGNRTKRTEISSGDYEVYEWDHRNRLISVTSYDVMDTETKSVDQTYDIFNRWIRRTTDPDGPGGSSAVDTFFTYDGLEPILQFDGSADTDLTNRYLFGPAVDQILASEDVTSLGSAGNTVWALSDHLGIVGDIADQNEGTNTTTVTNHRTYDSFGARTAETNSTVDLLFGFTGKAFDEDTGVQHNWNRWYDSFLTSWLSEDPIQFYAGDGNLRRYVSNSPLVFSDSDGLQEKAPTPAPKPKEPPSRNRPLPTPPVTPGFGRHSGPDEIIDHIGIPVDQVPGSKSNWDKDGIHIGQDQPPVRRRGHLIHELIAGFLHNRFFGIGEMGIQGTIDGMRRDGRQINFPVSGSHNLGLIMELGAIAEKDPAAITPDLIEELDKLAVVPAKGEKQKMPFLKELDELTKWLKEVFEGKHNGEQFTLEFGPWKTGILDKEVLYIGITIKAEGDRATTGKTIIIFDD